MDTTLGNSPNITSYDVAREAGVSIGTVSRVLTNQPNVDQELRSRVLKAIDLLGYVHVPKKRRAVPKINDIVVSSRYKLFVNHKNKR